LPDLFDGFIVSIDVNRSSELSEVGRNHGHQNLHQDGVGLFSGGHHIAQGRDKAIPHVYGLSNGNTLHGKGQGVLAASEASEDFVGGSSHLELEFSRLSSANLVDKLVSKSRDGCGHGATSDEVVAAILEGQGDGNGSTSKLGHLIKESAQASFTKLSVVEIRLHLQGKMGVSISGIFFLLVRVDARHDGFSNGSGVGAD